MLARHPPRGIPFPVARKRADVHGASNLRAVTERVPPRGWHRLGAEPREMIAMSWQRPFKELNPEVDQLVVTVLEEGKGAGQSPEWQRLGSVTRLDCHNPLCQRGGVDLHHTLREMVATRRAELGEVKWWGGVEGGGPGAGPRHFRNRFAFRTPLASKAESDRGSLGSPRLSA